MEIGNLVKYECHGDIDFGLVFNTEVDDYNQTLFWIWWFGEGDSSREYPEDSAIMVIQ